MLVCPKCHFENPDTNNFCQHCGISLTHEICGGCGSQVPFTQEHCHNCGASTGKIWWAVISKVAKADIEILPTPATPVTSEKVPDVLGDKVAAQLNITEDNLSIASVANQNLAEGTQEHSLSPADISSEVVNPLASEQNVNVATISGENNTETTPQKDSDGDITSPLSATVYLDAQERYRILDLLPGIEDVLSGAKDFSAPIKIGVLDCQPFQKSLLETLIDGEKNSLGSGQKPTNNINVLNAQFWKDKALPAIAQPYLALQSQSYPGIPKIHDAWVENGRAVLILENRSQWELLEDLWKNDQVSMLQILHWMGEIIKLWIALEPWYCRQSLLEINNLRVDEDQTMSLQQLYQEPKDSNLTLKDLGKVWQVLFHESQRTQFNSLDQLFRDLIGGEIGTTGELRSRLVEIGNEIQHTQDLTLKTNSLSETTEGDDSPTVILPMQLLSLEDAGSTDIGRLRNHNEDYFAINTQIKTQENPLGRAVQAHGLYILCDGMGGHAGGEVASAMAVETIGRYFEANWQDRLPSESSIREAVLAANQAIFDINQQNARSGSGRMGTTLVMVLIQDTNIAIAHVGDSRLYRVSRKRPLEQITVDHEVGQREIQRGVEASIAYARPDALQLTQALGPRDEDFVNPDVQFLELNEDTLLLLCSDGLSDNDLLENYWETHLLPFLSSRTSLEQAVQQLIDLANEHNGHDNITAVLIRLKVRPNLAQQQPL